MSEDISPPTNPSDIEQWRWTSYAHFSGLSCLVGIPSFVGPLVFWLVKKDTMPIVDREAKEALNFQLTIALVQLISIPLVFIVIGFFTAIAAVILSVIFAIIAGIKSTEKTAYTYPMTIRFIK